MKLFKLMAGLFTSLVICASASAAIIYENGALNGTYGAVSISPPQSVTNSFTISTPARVTGVTLGLWTAPGTQPASLSFAFGTSPFSSDIASGTAALSNVFAFYNGGFDVYLSSFAVNQAFSAGEYWLTLGDGRNNFGGEIFWDINLSPSSQAQFRNNEESGPIDSEYFVLTGDNLTDPDPEPNPQPVPEPASLALLTVGMIGFAASRRRRANTAA
jgi:hypothetical protein